MKANPLTGFEENELRRRSDLHEDTARALATLSHSRDVFGRMLVEADDRIEAYGCVAEAPTAIMGFRVHIDGSIEVSTVDQAMEVRDRLVADVTKENTEIVQLKAKLETGEAKWARQDEEYQAWILELEGPTPRELLDLLSECGTNGVNADTCGICGLHFAECEAERATHDDTPPIQTFPACVGARARAMIARASKKE